MHKKNKEHDDAEWNVNHMPVMKESPDLFKEQDTPVKNMPRVKCQGELVLGIATQAEGTHTELIALERIRSSTTRNQRILMRPIAPRTLPRI